ncbi:MAG: hypothetical protein D8M57_14550 [Candidatus Scalindua sp. AMX11]|nr:MAG: hypothetical protein DWQ00_17390 [Candidatus Scalindua sp.]NOG83907.1 hypothetical protein [Planctomycetota bacterium]RZV87979.1 MAG: hypothetical protein EX341_06625 [Candidatus Scalindua sp. SCAELEC01]TDE64128.1 MAG: hypothetical protein D8M57_14550 [Candidatus Scalindua sp. AMX11]GJQ58445.1 MAG: hypothetical protein SCALA701_12460 [Candidatus Scalindua sp.]
MGFLDSLFGKKDKKMLLELVEHNADMIEKDEGRTRTDAEYLSICLVLDDLATRPNGNKGYKIIMDMLQNEYSQHHNDVFTYLAVKSGKIKLKPEADEALMKRHQKFRKDETTEHSNYNLSVVEEFFSEAKKCLNPKDGPEFVSGTRAAYFPIDTAVAEAVGEHLEYGDTLLKYAELTADNPHKRIKSLLDLASVMKFAPACGFRFLVGQLILQYYSFGALREGKLSQFESSMLQISLNEECLNILESASQYR